MMQDLVSRRGRALGPLLLLAGLALASPASSERWRSAPDASTLEFSAVFDGAPFDGRFGTFSVTLEATDDDLTAATLAVTVSLASVDTRNGERDATLAEGEWFDTGAHPEARYRAERFERLGPGRWRAPGELTLKGRSNEVPIEFALEPAAGDGYRLTGALRLRGDATVDRMAFDVGTGEWADPELIGHAVEVRFDVRLESAAP